MMFAHFHGWRRTFGLITLAIAMTMMAGWIRSISVRDVVGFSTKQTEEIFSSSNHSLVWLSYRFSPDSPNYMFQHEFSDFKVDSTAVRVDSTLLNDAGVKWKWRACGFGRRQVELLARHGGTNVLWVMPYWSVAIPLTLLSAWLLVSLPRPRQLPPASR